MKTFVTSFMDDPNPIDAAYSVRFVSAWQFIAWTNLRKNHLQCVQFLKAGKEKD